MTQNKAVHIVGFSLLTIGGLNWGLVGLFNLNLVELIIGSWSPVLEKLIYILVGISAVFIFITHRKDCRICGTPGPVRQT